MLDQMSAQMRDQMRAQMLDQMSAQKLYYFFTYMWGSLDSFWIAYYKFTNDVLHLEHTKNNIDQLYALETLARSTGFWYPLDGICIMCDRPLSRWDENRQLHSDAFPAIEFSDGWNLYFWHGIKVPERAIKNINSYSANEILAEKNSEVRRALMSLYGYERILPEMSAKLIDRHPNPMIGELYGWKEKDGTIKRVVKCLNGTLNPDGTQKWYYLAVPPEMEKVVQANKWTYLDCRKMSDQDFVAMQDART
jgi:hypothetical protein